MFWHIQHKKTTHSLLIEIEDVCYYSFFLFCRSGKDFVIKIGGKKKRIEVIFLFSVLAFFSFLYRVISMIIEEEEEEKKLVYLHILNKNLE